MAAKGLFVSFGVGFGGYVLDLLLLKEPWFFFTLRVEPILWRIPPPPPPPPKLFVEVEIDRIFIVPITIILENNVI